MFIVCSFFRSICQKFNISQSTALYATRRVTKILADMTPAIIKWPEQENVQDVWLGFEAISAFPKIIGAIDSKHINIPAPRKNPEAYVNRKGHHSIQLQVRTLNCAILFIKINVEYCFRQFVIIRPVLPTVMWDMQAPYMTNACFVYLKCRMHWVIHVS